VKISRPELYPTFFKGDYAVLFDNDLRKLIKDFKVNIQLVDGAKPIFSEHMPLSIQVEGQSFFRN
jgi:hypothetical protein